MVESEAAAEQRIGKPHAVCIPYPAQGHITPMIQLAKLLHRKGFHITFVNTDYNHQRLIGARGSDAVRGVEGFAFKSIPDGLPETDPDRTQDVWALCESMDKGKPPQPFLDLLDKLNQPSPDHQNPTVTCIVADGGMTFARKAAEQLGVPLVYLCTNSACGFWGYCHYPDLIGKGYTPLKEESQLTNGYLDTKIDWISGMPDIELKHLPSFIRTLDRDDTMLNYCMKVVQEAFDSSAIVINTFDELEHPVLAAARGRYPHLFTIGPLLTLGEESSIPMNGGLADINSSLWPEEQSCVEWLNRQQEGSVVYVSFGSITVMSPHQMLEFAWGLANSGYPFVWVIRPDLINGEAAVLPKEFILETRERGLLVSWCPQQKILTHPSVGLFLTHCGWNSTIESIWAGVLMLCWPFFGEQPTNCRYVCRDWGIGMEIDSNVERDRIESQVREMLDGEMGKETRRRARAWKEASEKAIAPGGSSRSNLDRVISEVLLKKVAVDSSNEKNF